MKSVTPRTPKRLKMKLDNETIGSDILNLSEVRGSRSPHRVKKLS